jgi:hypothetical protein
LGKKPNTRKARHTSVRDLYLNHGSSLARGSSLCQTAWYELVVCCKTKFRSSKFSIVLLFGGVWHTLGDHLATVGSARSCAHPCPCTRYKKARSICAWHHDLQWWRHASDTGAREGVRRVPARRCHAYSRPTVHERDAQALCS